MKYQTKNQAKIVLWIIALIVLVVHGYSFSIVYANDNPFDNQSMLNQSDWLSGYGVDVYYNFSYTPDTRFFAIELPTRLYAKRLGYPSNWYVSTPQQLKSKVESGFEDLIFYPNGGDVGPEMGDILLWDDHVAVVDQVYTGTLGIVQQNIWSVYDSTGVPIATDTIAYFSEENYYAIQGVLGWVRSPVMSRLLSGALDPLGIAGDWNGDGIDTIGVYNQATSEFFLRNNNEQGSPDIQFQFGEPRQGWIPLVADWNGDGVDTVGLFDPIASVYYLKNSNTAGDAELSFVYGPPEEHWWMPNAGDWNNSGADSIGIYNRNRGTVYLKLQNNPEGPVYSFYYGPRYTNWIPLAGDWNGDGIDSAGFYNPDESQFFLKNQHNREPAEITLIYGSPMQNWWPIAGDWNGDGVDTIGLYTFQKESSLERHLFLLNATNTPEGPTRFVQYYLQYVVWFPYWVFGTVQ